MRYKITFSYDGSNFHGYQNQPNLRTVQRELERAVTYLNQKHETSVQSSGRTDQGVHAIAQVAHFDLNIEIPEYKVKQGLNSLLPEDIHIIQAEKVGEDFHARFTSLKKEYIYKINTKEYNPMRRNYEYQHGKDLDIEKMKQAIKEFEGTHDFRSFVSSEDKRENSVRTIWKTKIQEEKGILTLTFQADGFLKYQVRNMVGLLIDIGNGKKQVEDVKKILEKKDRRFSTRTAPACGLYLRKVWYKS